MPGDDDEPAPVAPELFVPDVPAAVRFYVDRLGFRLLREDSTFAIVYLGPAVVMLAHESLYGQAVRAPRGLAIDVRIMVPDVDAVRERCRQQGVTVVHEIADREYGLRDFIISDPNGFRLRFASPLG
ncbi:MAG: VOC family protein [Dehalococcoidia bacterium]|nr:VOC family protein [Dehalococcoidia bacterium]